jgi:pimeloyl-ACP methyl ester carboxylesterase
MEPRALLHEVKGDGDPVVLVPGGLTGWLSWIPHAERLSTRWRTIRVQPIHNELGSAGQRGDPGYTSETERESLRMTLDVLGIEMAHFAGWSAGGSALIEFALAHSQRVRSMTLIEPGAYWLLEQLGESASDVESLTAFMHTLSGKEVTEDDLATMLELAGLVPSRLEARSHPYWERAVPHRMTLSWASKDLVGSPRSIQELENIRCPVLLVQGSVTTDVEKHVVDILGKRLPNAPVLELPGDHASHIQSIDAFLDAFERHLRTARSESA